MAIHWSMIIDRCHYSISRVSISGPVWIGNVHRLIFVIQVDKASVRNAIKIEACMYVWYIFAGSIKSYCDLFSFVPNISSKKIHS